MTFRPEDVRVAFVTPSRARGWRCQPIFRQLTKIYPHTIVFTGYWPGFTAAYVGSFEVREFPGTRFFPASRRETGALKGFTWISPRAGWNLLRCRPDVVFTNGFHLCALYAWLSKIILGTRVVLLWQGVSAETGGQRGSLRLRVRQVMRRCFDLCICNTKAGVDYLVGTVGISAERVWHEVCEVPDPDTLASAGTPPVKLPERPQPGPAFLFVGRIIPEKGLATLLRACGILVQRGLKGFSLVVVGDGPQRNELQQMASELGIHDRTQWMGFVPYEEIGKYYYAYDIYVLPSAEDTWGIAALEAMRCGKPVLCSASAGCKEVIRHGVNGFLFEPENVEELVNYMAQYISHTDLIAEHGLKSRELSSRYTPERAAAVMDRAVRAVMSYGTLPSTSVDRNIESA